MNRIWDFNMEQAELLKILSDWDAKNVHVSGNSPNVIFSCIHGKNHKNGDAHPSCSVSFGGDEVSLVNCRGCGFRGTFLHYVAIFVEEGGGKCADVLERVKKTEKKEPTERIDAAVRKWENQHFQGRKSDDAEESNLEVFEEGELSAFRRILKPSFLNSRRISPAVAQQIPLMWDDKFSRVVVPIRRRDGALVGCYGRCWCQKCQECKPGDVKPHGSPHYNYWSFPKSKFLFGENFLSTHLPVYVVEGCFDALRLASVGFDNAVALMGTTLSDVQYRKLVSVGQPVILAFDGDDAGKRCTATLAKELQSLVPSIRICEFPIGKDPKKMEDEDLRNCIQNAKLWW